jgi:hypothetical protein
MGILPELEISSGIATESILIEHICFEEMHNVLVAPVLLG